MIHNWFTIKKIDNMSYVIREEGHRFQANSYLLLGSEEAFLIDTGLGVANIREVTDSLTDLPVRVITTHVHWDHIGGHHLYKRISVHKKEVEWMKEGIPFPAEKIKKSLVDGIERPELLPEKFTIENYDLFSGNPDRILEDNDIINPGHRMIRVLHTPGHSPGHICLFDEGRGYLFTGDIIYKGRLYAFFHSTDPGGFYNSIIRINKLEGVDRIFPAHYDININSDFIEEVEQAFRGLKEKNKLHHGSGVHEYDSFAIRL